MVNTPGKRKDKYGIGVVRVTGIVDGKTNSWKSKTIQILNLSCGERYAAREIPVADEREKTPLAARRRLNHYFGILRDTRT